MTRAIKARPFDFPYDGKLDSLRTALLVIDPGRATNNEVRIGHWLKIDHREQGVTSEHATYEVEEGKDDQFGSTQKPGD